jgi:hypothetical protein
MHPLIDDHARFDPFGAPIATNRCFDFHLQPDVKPSLSPIGNYAEIDSGH